MDPSVLLELSSAASAASAPVSPDSSASERTAASSLAVATPVPGTAPIVEAREAPAGAAAADPERPSELVDPREAAVATYRRMLKNGVPWGAVWHKMSNENVPQELINFLRPPDAVDPTALVKKDPGRRFPVFEVLPRLRFSTGGVWELAYANKKRFLGVTSKRLLAQHFVKTDKKPIPNTATTQSSAPAPMVPLIDAKTSSQIIRSLVHAAGAADQVIGSILRLTSLFTKKAALRELTASWPTDDNAKTIQAYDGKAESRICDAERFILHVREDVSYGASTSIGLFGTVLRVIVFTEDLEPRLNELIRDAEVLIRSLRILTRSDMLKELLAGVIETALYMRFGAAGLRKDVPCISVGALSTLKDIQSYGAEPITAMAAFVQVAMIEFSARLQPFLVEMEPVQALQRVKLSELREAKNFLRKGHADYKEVELAGVPFFDDHWRAFGERVEEMSPRFAAVFQELDYAEADFMDHFGVENETCKRVDELASHITTFLREVDFEYKNQLAKPSTAS